MKDAVEPQPSLPLPARAEGAMRKALVRTRRPRTAVSRLIASPSLLSPGLRPCIRLSIVCPMWRWPLADPREVVDLAGAGTLADGPVEADLSAELRHWRGVVARRRLVALVRRQGAIALALAALLEILALLGLFPQWVVVAVPLAGLLVGVTWSAARGPSPFDLARLLDDKLGLNDRLATALEIVARGGEESALERRTVDDAAALLRAGREDWRGGAGARGGG